MTAQSGNDSSGQRDPARVEGVMLSAEELFVLLRLQHVTAIPGFDTTWATDAQGTLTPRGRDCVAPAMRALAARGFLQASIVDGPDGPSTHALVSTAALALTGVCARSASTTRVVSHAPGFFGEFFLHLFEGLGAYHTSDKDGVHTFVPLEGRAGVIQSALALAGLEPGKTPPTPGWRSAALPKDALERAALAGAKGDAPGAEAALAALEPDLRAGLARALLARGRISEITVAVRQTDGATTERLVFCVTAPGSAWALAADGPAQTMRLLGPDPATVVRQWLEGALPR